VASFSGGWRMRINLARCLFQTADLLLLDEPTNYLELESVAWLEDYLNRTQTTTILISHDRHFIDEVATHIVHIDQQQLNLYRGNYSSFERQRAEKIALLSALQAKQEKKRAHLQEFVNRFRAKASKAKQAQSRLKALEKLETIAQMQFDAPFQFNIPPAKACSNPMLQLKHVDTGYAEHTISSDVEFSIETQARIGLLGPNGAGKSTLIKTLIGELALQAGERVANPHLAIGYFAQHQVDELPLEKTLLQYFREQFPQQSESHLRAYLGRYAFSGDQVHQTLDEFSGGEKSRVALAQILATPKNLIILDEPTNHLDIEIREALTLALQEYEGALLLVSHDRFLLESLVDEFYCVYQGSVSRFQGDLDDYQRWYWQQKELETTPRNTAASTNKPVKTVQKNLARLEKEMQKIEKQIKQMEQELEDPSLYTREQAEGLQQKTGRLAELRQRLKELEEEWLG
jgi:ATP-binding cassette subfamily F protein 3